MQDKKVLLFSGGLDSFIISQLEKPDVLLHVTMGSVYTEVERNRLDVLVEKGYINNDQIVISNNIDLQEFEREDAIIPNRNIYLITLASHHGNTILFGSINGDRSCDKDEPFYEKMTNLLDHVWQAQHWTKERKFSITAPYKDKTKTEIVKMYLDAGLPSEALFDSYSCYSGKETHCGSCKPCFRKWVALVNNELSIPKGYFLEDPSDSPHIKNNLEAIKLGTYRGAEDSEILRALEILGKG